MSIVGLLGVVLLANVPAAPRGEAPAPGVLRRPTRAWLQEAVRSPQNDGMATDGRYLFVLRSDRRQIVALDAATGREVWAAKAVSQTMSYPPFSQVAVSDGLVIAKGSDDQLAAFNAADGKRLWTRKEPCDIEVTAGRWAVLRCHARAGLKSDGSLHIVDVKTGREDRVIPFDWLGELALSDRAVFTWTNRARMLRKTPLVAGESRWEAPIDAVFVKDIVADADVAICVGREVHAIDAATGKLLWSQRPVANHRGPAITPVLNARRVYLGMTDAIVSFDERSGQEQRRYPLPDFLRPQPGNHPTDLLVAGERVVVDAEDIIVTWSASGAPATVIAQPMALSWSKQLVGDMLVALAAHDQFIAAYSVAKLQPALADLPQADAIRAVEADVAVLPRFRARALRQIPGIQPQLGKLGVAAADITPPATPEPVKPGVCKAGVRKLPDLQPGAPPGVFGTAHPIRALAAAPDGRWIAACQARQDTNADGKIHVRLDQHGWNFGDPLSPYLIVGGGAGHPFDEYIGHAPSGRYVAVREGDCLNLVDTLEGTSTTLPDADLRDPESPEGAHRAISFDAVDKRVLYLRAGAGGDRIVVRDLKTGQETEIDPGPGKLVGARLDPEGQSIVIEATMGSRISELAINLGHRACSGGPMVYGAYGPPAVIVRRIVQASGGRARDVPGLIRSFGRDLLVRGDDRSLAVEDPQGRRRIIAPAACDARVSHVDAGRRAVVYACESDADNFGTAPLSVYRDGATIKLRVVGQVQGSDHWMQTTGRYASVDDDVIDLDKPGERPPASASAGGWRAGTFIRTDGRELRPLGARQRPSFGDVETGPLQWVAPVARPAPGQ